MSSSSSIPVIDFEDFPSQSHKLLQASQDWGCFRLINHTISINLMAEMKAAVRALLDLPAEIKRRNKDVIAGSGYVAPSKTNPLYEGLGLYDIASPESVHHFCSELEASPSQRETIVKYSAAVHELAMELGRMLCRSLGLDMDVFHGWPFQFRINKYNFSVESVGSAGVKLNTDSGFLTILQDDEHVGGLEVFDERSGEFVAVDPLAGSLLVNFGDVAKVWSNGRFCNVRHRVQCKEEAVRISIALFVLGPKEAAIEAPLELVDAEHPRLFVPFTFEDYRKFRLSTGLRAGEALADLLRDASS
ncbi:LOW QUALITY PROTEIN: 2-oxoglutarate-dependent dioxygenase DAO-like [Salvia miltiorrhiza]|uniref:LOW QUALITY PROTEIN: 2-oxoglutarate-dependent dioxygenase DAO-like n=1 Tax=Salvia miltiorrhiza TaxID=226208 RepID=UPI0025ABBCAD|nr:LOW QUALITY PROTEIN: 2-oxoglutarate-dependent dioxygenase DAO-like [Salvia miltiorrhiza]